MKVTALALAALAASATAHEGHDHDHRECGTEHNEADMEEAIAVATRFQQRVCGNEALSGSRLCTTDEKRAPVTIPVWYHIISSGNTGNMTDAQVQAQFDQTNKDFAGEEDQSIPGYAKMDITFSLAGITRTDNSQWFNDLERYETQIKSALAVDNTRNFNQYFGDFRAGLLGFCYFPNSFQESSFMHGCMNLYSSIPGGSSNGYNEGKTTTHETGHAIGLYHTFQGIGCSGSGDFVDDTCPQQSATNGCPNTAPASCGLSCRDPIHNYMDYSTDTCMTQFTPGQNDRANTQLATFRPSLYLSKAEIAAIGEHEPKAWDEAKTYSAKAEARYMAKKIEKYGAF